MEFAKLIDGNIIYSDPTILFDDVWISNPNKDQLSKLGYKEVIRASLPDILVNQYIENVYTENDDNIMISYNVKPFPIQLTKSDFRNKLTFDERVGIDNYEMTIDSMSIDEDTRTMRKSIMKTIIKDFDCANIIDLKDERTINGIRMLSNFGLLSNERVLEILN